MKLIKMICGGDIATATGHTRSEWEALLADSDRVSRLPQPSDRRFTATGQLTNPSPLASSPTAIASSVATLRAARIPTPAQPGLGGRLTVNVSAMPDTDPVATFRAAHAKPMMTLAQFRQLDQNERGQYMNEGGRLADDTSAVADTDPVATFRAKHAKPMMTLAQFRTLTPLEKGQYLKEGGKLTD